LFKYTQLGNQTYFSFLFEDTAEVAIFVILQENKHILQFT